jgi:hypothetical protein
LSNTINPNKETEQEKAKKTAFFNGFKKAIDQWEKTRPGQMPPVIQDKQGNWQWVNRKERRKLERKKKTRKKSKK